MLLFLWDDANREHIARDGIRVEAVEQVLSGDSFELEEQVVEGELRYVWIGETSHGRIVQVVFTERDGGSDLSQRLIRIHRNDESTFMRRQVSHERISCNPNVCK